MISGYCDQTLFQECQRTPETREIRLCPYWGVENEFLLFLIMYQLIPSLTIPPSDPRGFARSHCPGERRVFAQFSLPGGQGFEFEKFSTVLKEKCRNVSICFKESEAA